jgi:hypothetical protein
MLEDPLGDLPPRDREVLVRGTDLITYLDRALTRTGRVPAPRWVITPEPIGTTDLLREYITDVASRYYARVMRLDTRRDLVEARALYAAHGYAEIPAYSSGPYADHWYEKHL